MDVLERVAKHFGSRAKIGPALGLSEGAAYQWKRIPAARCIELSRLTGIPLHELRPDLYPRSVA